MRATQKVIAQMLGIDRTTVSKALSDSPTVSGAVKEQVKKLCSELGYRPHAGALSLVSYRTRTISLVGGFTGVEGVQGLWVMRLHEAAQRRGYRCRIDSHNDAATVASEASADGFIVFGQNSRHGSTSETYLPAVYTDCSGQGSPINSVTTGNAEAASSAVSYLYDLGHRQIAYFGVVQGHGVSMDRYQGFKEEMRQRKLHIPDGSVIIQEDWPVEVEDNYRHREQLLDSINAGATAVITTKDVVGAAVVRMLSWDGLKVPDDVSVIAWDDTLVTRAINPSLTSIRQNLTHAADCAIDMLIKLIESDEKEIPGIVIPSSLIIRESTAPPKC